MMIRKKIRIHKKDSAFVYAILESLEGMVSFSTLPNELGEMHRDLDLQVAPDFENDVEFVLESFRKKFSLIIL